MTGVTRATPTSGARRGKKEPTSEARRQKRPEWSGNVLLSRRRGRRRDRTSFYRRNSVASVDSIEKNRLNRPTFSTQSTQSRKKRRRAKRGGKNAQNGAATFSCPTARAPAGQAELRSAGRFPGRQRGRRRNRPSFASGHKDASKALTHRTPSREQLTCVVKLDRL